MIARTARALEALAVGSVLLGVLLACGSSAPPIPAAPPTDPLYQGLASSLSACEKGNNAAPGPDLAGSRGDRRWVSTLEAVCKTHGYDIESGDVPKNMDTLRCCGALLSAYSATAGS